MAEYAFEIRIIPEKKNVIADYRSRSIEVPESETTVDSLKIDIFSVADEG